MASSPTVSVILATDELQTLSDVLPYYRAQTIAAEIELVLPAPKGTGADVGRDDGRSVAGTTAESVGSIA